MTTEGLFPVGKKLPVLIFEVAMLLLEGATEVSTEGMAIRFELPCCDIPGVGITVLVEEDKLTCW